jgi:hypothetical protein
LHCLDAISAVCQQVLKRIDEVAVAQYIAFKNKPETPEEKRQHAALKEQKAALLEALDVKCR